jgi:hypothetical protein
MIWLISLNLTLLLGIAVLLLRMNRTKYGKPPLDIQPPQIYSNLPQVERVDLHALFSKWDD